ncbi:hypothetical protein HA62_06695 [Pseudomonas putida]|nr:hypothetical protein HA62_06695 [Pseudomonas putida]
MIDLTTRILLEKYQPDSPLLQVESAESEPVEVEKPSITMQELVLKVRSEMLTDWGLDPTERHAWADQTVAAWAAVFKCKEYNVIDLPPEGMQWSH